MSSMTHEEIMTSLTPERRKRIEEGAKAIIAELGLDKLSDDIQEDSLFFQTDEIHRPYSQVGARSQV